MLISTGRSALIPRFAVTVLCLWLGFGALASAGPPPSTETHACCCCGESVCLLGGCDCAERDTRDESPCGGLRSVDDFQSGLALPSFVRAHGIEAFGCIIPIPACGGSTLTGQTSSDEKRSKPPDPPPPRIASAC